MTQQEIFNQANINYRAIIDYINVMYDECFSKLENFNTAKIDMLKDLDIYIEALMLKIALADKDFAYVEAQFIKKITDYGTMFDDINLIDFANSEHALRAKLEVLADDILEDNIPLCIMYAVILDKNIDTSFAAGIKDKIEYLCISMSNIDVNGAKNEFEIETGAVIQYLVNIDNYCEENGLKLL